MKHITLKVEKPKAKEGVVVDPEHWKIESNHEELDGKFEDRYVNISGYFGPYNPNTFAAAPDMLDKLHELLEYFTDKEIPKKAQGIRDILEQATKQPKNHDTKITTIPNTQRG
jgi:hypothetical protein